MVISQIAELSARQRLPVWTTARKRNLRESRRSAVLVRYKFSRECLWIRAVGADSGAVSCAVLSSKQSPSKRSRTEAKEEGAGSKIGCLEYVSTDFVSWLRAAANSAPLSPSKLAGKQNASPSRAPTSSGGSPSKATSASAPRSPAKFSAGTGAGAGAGAGAGSSASPAKHRSKTDGKKTAAAAADKENEEWSEGEDMSYHKILELDKGTQGKLQSSKSHAIRVVKDKVLKPFLPPTAQGAAAAGEGWLFLGCCCLHVSQCCFHLEEKRSKQEMCQEAERQCWSKVPINVRTEATRVVGTMLRVSRKQCVLFAVGHSLRAVRLGVTANGMLHSAFKQSWKHCARVASGKVSPSEIKRRAERAAKAKVAAANSVRLQPHACCLSAISECVRLLYHQASPLNQDGGFGSDDEEDGDDESGKASKENIDDNDNDNDNDNGEDAAAKSKDAESKVPGSCRTCVC